MTFYKQESLEIYRQECRVVLLNYLISKQDYGIGTNAIIHLTSIY